MPNVALRGMSAQLHAELKAAAKRNHRSLNNEVLARLTASLHYTPVDPEALLARVQRRHESLGAVGIDATTLRELRVDERP